MTEIAKTLEYICKEYNFLIGNYYKNSDGSELSCRKQPFYINGEGKGLIEF